ncbi:hypothetical protein PBI_SCTP2_412 [Salicola phage SCTP-2]|nr:hypothetical protein PBI_SCTP2_412 [Salicola phage SCTP-2]
MGAHHKDWLLDQIARIVNNAPITIVEARWSNGHCEDRIRIGTCDEYNQWVEYVKDGEDGPEIPP